TGKYPVSSYKAIFKGSGLSWLSPVSVHWHTFYPNAVKWTGWNTGNLTALNLQQTLIVVTSLILTGLAVAFAFRCGLFNIGGNGQYIVGSVIGIWVGSSFAHMNGPLHVLLAVVLATGAGAVWAGIAGFLKATRGVHEVISTIMLNWIAVWLASWAFSQAGPLQNKASITVPISNNIAPGDPTLCKHL